MSFDFEQVEQLPDPLEVYQWRVQFLDVPDVIQEDARDLSLYATSTVIPSATFETTERNLGPHKAVYASKGDRTGTVDLTFKIHKDLVPLRVFDRWGNAIQDNFSGTGIPAEQYMCELLMTLKDFNSEAASDEAQNLSRTRLFMAWPTDPNDMDMQYDDQGQAEKTVPMQYSNIEKEFNAE